MSRLAAGLAWLAALAGGCAPVLGPPHVSYGLSHPIPLVQPSTDARRWYVPMATSSLGPVVWFVDTGYTYSTCDDALISALAIEPRGRVRIRGELGRVHAQKARLPPIELGGHRIGRLVCQVRDLGSTSSLDDPREVPIAGVIGMDVLRQFRVVFDPGLGVMELRDPRTEARLPTHGDGISRLRRAGLRGLRAQIELDVGDRTVWQILDTGAANTYLDGARLGLVPSSTHDNVVVRGTGAGGKEVRRLLSYELDSIRVGGLDAGAVTLIDRDRPWWEPGLLGLDVLSRFHQEYDFVSHSALLRPVEPRDLPQFSAYWLGSGAIGPRLLDGGSSDATSDRDGARAGGERSGRGGP